MHDCHEAMVKIKMAFKPDGKMLGAMAGGDGLILAEMDPNSSGKKRKKGRGGDEGNNNVANFGEYYTQNMEGQLGGMLVEPVMLLDPNEPMELVAGGGVGGAFAVPFSLDFQGGEGDNWIVAEAEYGDDIEQGGRKKRARRIDSTLSSNAAANLTLDSNLGNIAPGDVIEDEEEGWGAFDPDADMKDDEEEDEMEKTQTFHPEGDSETEGDTSRVELVRGANDSITSDRQLRVG